ncbi:MAG: hypothetical protein GY903_18850 [Fuerstiella sp.]|nr:hypothetical protein [Fuerstiella sp.]MCP4856545.1 hypothetical protein [Fuerstiella sp.]
MKTPALSLLLTAVTAVCGCATGPFPVCDPGDGGSPESAEWWAKKAELPPGVRQVCYKGKTWPVRPRPTGERQQFTHTYHSAHYWPLPYVCQDREYMRNIADTQTSLGWQQETTLYDRHFEGGRQLNVPGRLHLTDILEVAPSSRRTVYVQSSYDAEKDNARVANVQQVIAELTGGTELLPVVLRKGRDYSRPASEVKVINDLYTESIPTPRLGSGSSSTTAAPATGP